LWRNECQSVPSFSVFRFASRNVTSAKTVEKNEDHQTHGKTTTASSDPLTVRFIDSVKKNPTARPLITASSADPFDTASWVQVDTVYGEQGLMKRKKKKNRV
jgi:hypothetical protein